MKLQRYLFRQLLVAFGLSVAGILFIALPGMAVSAVQRIPFADASLLWQYLPLAVKTVAPYALPVCYLLAIVSVYGRMAADGEWTAILMAGVHPWKMLGPGLALGSLLAAGTYWTASVDLPRSKQQQRELLGRVAELSITKLKPGRTTLQFQNFFLTAKSRDPHDPNVLFDVHIRRPGESADEHLDVFARKVKVRVHHGRLLVDLFDAQSYSNRYESKLALDSLHYEMSIADLVGAKQGGQPHPAFMTSRAIRAEIRSGVTDEHRGVLLDFELHYRKAMAAIYFVFLALGAPLGLLLRRGTQLGALSIAIGLGLLYFMLSIELGRDLGRSGNMAPWIGAWFAPLLGAVGSIPLMLRILRR